jgi:hypothetical protein
VSLLRREGKEFSERQEKRIAMMRKSEGESSLSDGMKHQVECEQTAKKIKKSLDNSLLMWYYCKALERDARTKGASEE